MRGDEGFCGKGGEAVEARRACMLKIEGAGGAKADNVGPEAFMLREWKERHAWSTPLRVLCAVSPLCSSRGVVQLYKEGYIHVVSSNSKWYTSYEFVLEKGYSVLCCVFLLEC